VIGHSLGGAMASICALEMRLAVGVETVRVTTFGSPRVGNPKFHDLFKRVMDRSMRFTHNNDIVPSVPTLMMGFQHVRTEVRSF
jgi:predicted lipase